jgi:hypothetical protein
MLRQDPDVMMVGEVRDLETADIAIRAALTGHLILSTLHTNDAASGVTRLLDIGVEPYLIASSVVAFIAQRLIRVICPHCKTEDTQVSPEIKKLIESEYGIPQGDIRVFRGTGCEECGQTGFRGRIAIHEFLPLTEEIRKLIMERMTAETIKLAATRQGMTSLRFSGWEKVLAGVTTPEEVLETTEEDKLELLGDVSGGDLAAGSNRNAEMQSLVKIPQVLAAGMPPSQKVPGFQFTNLRKFERVVCDVPVTFRILEYKGVMPLSSAAKAKLAAFEFEGHARDLSAGGIYFSVDDPKIAEKQTGGDAGAYAFGKTFESGSILDLKILLKDGGKPVECMAMVKILRVTHPPGKPGSAEPRRVGASFLSIHSEDRHRLVKFCEAHKEPHETV